MIMPNWLYNLLKIAGSHVLPAVAAFYETIATLWGLPYSDKIPPTIMAVVVLLNSCLGFSSARYYEKLAKSVQEAEGTLDPEDIEHYEAPDGTIEG